MKTHHEIRDIEQVKALSSPIRQRILAEFVPEPRTTKQVADKLEMSATKLYRHVDQLARVGLIELIETRPKRGTTEKYFRAIASRFSIADEGLGGGALSAVEQSFSEAFAAVRTHIRSAVDSESLEKCAAETLLALGSLRLAPEDLPIIRECLLTMTNDLPSDPATRKPFGYLVAIYPSNPTE